MVEYSIKATARGFAPVFSQPVTDAQSARQDEARIRARYARLGRDVKIELITQEVNQ